MYLPAFTQYSINRQPVLIRPPSTQYYPSLNSRSFNGNSSYTQKQPHIISSPCKVSLIYINRLTRIDSHRANKRNHLKLLQNKKFNHNLTGIKHQIRAILLILIAIVSDLLLIKVFQKYPYLLDQDIERRFAEALIRTKRIVDRFNQKQSMQNDLFQSYLQSKNQNGSKKTLENSRQRHDEQIDLHLVYEDGFQYKGQGYNPNVKSGYGVLYDQNQEEVYNGHWKSNTYHGKGRLRNLNSTKLKSFYDFSHLGKVANGWSGYDGEFSNGKMHGTGLLILTNGEKYKGSFANGVIHGEGTFTVNNGELIHGIWQQGKLVHKLQ